VRLLFGEKEKKWAREGKHKGAKKILSRAIAKSSNSTSKKRGKGIGGENKNDLKARAAVGSRIRKGPEKGAKRGGERKTQEEKRCIGPKKSPERRGGGEGDAGTESASLERAPRTSPSMERGGTRGGGLR